MSIWLYMRGTFFWINILFPVLCGYQSPIPCTGNLVWHLFLVEGPNEPRPRPPTSTPWGGGARPLVSRGLRALKERCHPPILHQCKGYFKEPVLPESSIRQWWVGCPRTSGADPLYGVYQKSPTSASWNGFPSTTNAFPSVQCHRLSKLPWEVTS